MKLISRQEMLEMPEGTIFQAYTPHWLGELSISGGRCGGGVGDIVEAQLTPSCTMPQTHNGKKYSIETPSGFGREGLFDDKIRYLIWEPQDRLRLAMWLLNPMEAINEMNDDDGKATILHVDF